MNGAAAVLEAVRKKGVRLWLENGQLRYKAPRGLLSEAEIEALKHSKEHIVAQLRNSDHADESARGRSVHPRTFSAPLSFSQLAHWHLYELGERTSLALSAAVNRLHGRLDMEAFRASVAEVVRRHDVLRTRIVPHEGGPVQEVTDAAACRLVVEDLQGISSRFRRIEIKRHIERFMLTPVDVSRGPLSGLLLLRLSDTEHVLALTMEHIITDARSKSLLLQELLQAYTQLKTRGEISLPAIPVQFTDYAVWQSGAHSSWLERHGGYWEERLRGACRLGFSRDGTLPQKIQFGLGAVPVEIGAELRGQLLAWSRTQRTTLVMSIFTAFAALVLRWCKEPEGVLRYQIDGRNNPKIENAIGYFASKLFLKIELREEDDFATLLQRVTQEYGNAYEHCDFSYIESQMPQPAFARNSMFNWVPLRSAPGVAAAQEERRSLSLSAMPFEYLALRYWDLEFEPSIILYDTDNGIVGHVEYPASLFARADMERFAACFMRFIRALLESAQGRVKDVPLL